jgi:secondary thiamine-phosphate synthase enzyme
METISMERFSIRTRKRCEFIPIESRLQELAVRAGVQDGVAHVFIPHTTAGITINENADPDVVADMDGVLDRLAPWRGNYAHAEGNTAAHVKASLMGSSATVLIEKGQLQLGTWQSLYFCEFDGPRERQVWVQFG